MQMWTICKEGMNMEYIWNGPWPLKQLIDDPNIPFPEKVGNYVISISSEKYNSDIHGPSKFIYIGGMKTSENSSLAKRLGEFVAASFGFKTRHSGGWTFYDKCNGYKLSAWDLELWWIENDDPICGEVTLFRSYRKIFGMKPLLNKNEKRTGCSLDHHLELHSPWEKGKNQL